MSPTGHFIPPLLVFPRKNMKQIMNGTRVIPRGGYRARFFPSGFFISSNIQSRQRRSCYFNTGRTLFTHQEPGGHYFSSREIHVDIIYFPSHNSHKMQPLDKAFMVPLKTFYYQEIEKLAPFTLRVSRHRLPNWRTIRKCIQVSCNRRNGG